MQTVCQLSVYVGAIDLSNSFYMVMRSIVCLSLFVARWFAADCLFRSSLIFRLLYGFHHRSALIDCYVFTGYLGPKTEL